MKINEYALEQLTFQDESYYDIDFWTGSGYESKKILGSVIKAGIQAGLVDTLTFTNALADKLDIPTGDNTQYLDGAGVPTLFPTIPVVPLEKLIFSIDSENLTSAGGGTNWNGVANIGAPASATLNQGFKFKTFAVVGQPDGIYFNGIIPTFYQIGNTIKITIVWTSQDAGDCAWNVGLTKPTVGGQFGAEVQTDWQVINAPIAGGFPITKISLTFTGTGFAIGDPFAVKIFRDNGNANDTLTGDAYLNSVNVEQS